MNSVDRAKPPTSASTNPSNGAWRGCPPADTSRCCSVRRLLAPSEKQPAPCITAATGTSRGASSYSCCTASQWDVVAVAAAQNATVDAASTHDADAAVGGATSIVNGAVDSDADSPHTLVAVTVTTAGPARQPVLSCSGSWLVMADTSADTANAVAGAGHGASHAAVATTEPPTATTATNDSDDTSDVESTNAPAHDTVSCVGAVAVAAASQCHDCAAPDAPLHSVYVTLSRVDTSAAVPFTCHQPSTSGAPAGTGPAREYRAG